MLFLYIGIILFNFIDLKLLSITKSYMIICQGVAIVHKDYLRLHFSLIDIKNHG